MNEDHHTIDDRMQVELHIAQVVYAATSKGYRLALAAAVSAEYAKAVLKEKLPAYLHADIETFPLPALGAGDEERQTFAAWVPDMAREGLAKTGESGGYYFSEYYYSMASTGHEWDRFFSATEVATDDFLAERATPEIPKAVMDHWDRMVAAMQMPQQKAAEEALFRATPDELGKAAVRDKNLKTKNTT
jgi:hypothetical protein